MFAYAAPIRWTNQVGRKCLSRCDADAAPIRWAGSVSPGVMYTLHQSGGPIRWAGSVSPKCLVYTSDDVYDTGGRDQKGPGRSWT